VLCRCGLWLASVHHSAICVGQLAVIQRLITEFIVTLVMVSNYTLLKLYKY
jgi:hypothetical protein